MASNKPSTSPLANSCEYINENPTVLSCEVPLPQHHRFYTKFLSLVQQCENEYDLQAFLQDVRGEVDVQRYKMRMIEIFEELVDIGMFQRNPPPRKLKKKRSMMIGFDSDDDPEILEQGSSSEENDSDEYDGEEVAPRDAEDEKVIQALVDLLEHVQIVQHRHVKSNLEGKGDDLSSTHTTIRFISTGGAAAAAKKKFAVPNKRSGIKSLYNNSNSNNVKIITIDFQSTHQIQQENLSGSTVHECEFEEAYTIAFYHQPLHQQQHDASKKKKHQQKMRFVVGDSDEDDDDDDDEQPTETVQMVELVSGERENTNENDNIKRTVNLQALKGLQNLLNPKIPLDMLLRFVVMCVRCGCEDCDSKPWSVARDCLTEEEFDEFYDYLNSFQVPPPPPQDGDGSNDDGKTNTNNNNNDTTSSSSSSETQQLQQLQQHKTNNDENNNNKKRKSQGQGQSQSQSSSNKSNGKKQRKHQQ